MEKLSINLKFVDISFMVYSRGKRTIFRNSVFLSVFLNIRRVYMGEIHVLQVNVIIFGMLVKVTLIGPWRLLETICMRLLNWHLGKSLIHLLNVIRHVLNVGGPSVVRKLVTWANATAFKVSRPVYLRRLHLLHTFFRRLSSY